MLFCFFVTNCERDTEIRIYQVKSLQELLKIVYVSDLKKIGESSYDKEKGIWTIWEKK